MKKLPSSFILSREVQEARSHGKAIVALESTVITHGLPKPENLQLAKELEEIIRAEGVTPATIAIVKGKIHIGLEAEELELLSNASKVLKLSSRDVSSAISGWQGGGTTVAATLRLASAAGISIFATGGIGGVHRDSNWDVSADLHELSKQELILVCAGAKAILDLPATIEVFETLGIPVLGYKTSDFPAFYSRNSGLPVSARMESLEEVVSLSQAHWEIGGKGILLAAPIPESDALTKDDVEQWITQALSEGHKKGLLGPETTPFLLKRLGELSNNRTLVSNLALLRNNAGIAAKLAKLESQKQSRQAKI
jgi:pseudouridine-5'-phosphate glycosidase